MMTLARFWPNSHQFWPNADSTKCGTRSICQGPVVVVRDPQHQRRFGWTWALGVGISTTAHASGSTQNGCIAKHREALGSGPRARGGRSARPRCSARRPGWRNGGPGSDLCGDWCCGLARGPSESIVSRNLAPDALSPKSEAGAPLLERNSERRPPDRPLRAPESSDPQFVPKPSTPPQALRPKVGHCGPATTLPSPRSERGPGGPIGDGDPMRCGDPMRGKAGRSGTKFDQLRANPYRSWASSGRSWPSRVQIWSILGKFT